MCSARTTPAEGDDAVADRPDAAAPRARSSSRPSSAATMVAGQSAVPGLTLDQLRADELLWSVYERGWRDAHAAALAAYVVHPPMMPIAATPPPPSADPRPTSAEPVRGRSRANRQSRCLKVPARPTGSSQGSSVTPPSTAETLQYDEEEETYKKNCHDWVNNLEFSEQCGPEDIICPGSDIGSMSSISQTSEEAEDTTRQPLQNHCFRNYTTAETVAFKSLWLNIPSIEYCDHHCVIHYKDST